MFRDLVGVRVEGECSVGKVALAARLPGASSLQSPVGGADRSGAGDCRPQVQRKVPPGPSLVIAPTPRTRGKGTLLAQQRPLPTMQENSSAPEPSYAFLEKFEGRLKKALSPEQPSHPHPFGVPTSP